MPSLKPASQLFHNARREALIVAVVWTAALLWTVGYCYLHGYEHPPDSWVRQIGLAPPPEPERLELYWGMPSWVVFGIITPWLLCSVFTVGFSLFSMTDDDLGAELDAELGDKPGDEGDNDAT